jgi:uncharacterized protein involved in exopolysaccharide biosynthesis
VSSDPDLEIADVAAALRGGGGRFALGLALGLGAALLTLWLAPARFEGRALVLIRTQGISAGQVMREQFGQLSQLAGSALGLGEDDDPIKTELALLRSRALLGEVVDSLRLQLRAGRRPPVTLDAEIPREGRFKPRKVAVDGGSAKLVDREDAIDDLAKRLSVDIAGGEAVEIEYRSRDSVSAALVPNLIAARYLERRKTVDRGLNQRRAEFLERQQDSVRQALDAATAGWRRTQERGAGLSVEGAAQAELEQRTALTAKLTETTAELEAMRAVLADLAAGQPQRVAGMPALLRSPAVNELVAELGRRETERRLLLAEVTERDPRAVALAEAIADLRQQLEPLARTYAQALESQRGTYAAQLARTDARLQGLPAAGERQYLAQVEVDRLTRLNLALATQVLEARLAALGEGGDVRVVDAAVVPRRADFPRPSITLLGGAFAGLLLGLVLALVPLLRAPAPEA